jgi:magnesium-transporting ATPase (P-type)
LPSTYGVDFAIILVLLLFNAVLGFWHERQAADALDALKDALAQEAQASRSHTRMCAAQRQLVTRTQLKINRDWIAIAAGCACQSVTVGDIRWL